VLTSAVMSTGANRRICASSAATVGDPAEALDPAAAGVFVGAGGADGCAQLSVRAANATPPARRKDAPREVTGV
jgi:hypothetical protein